MSDGYRNGAFARGLVVGGGVALDLFLWLDFARATKYTTQSGGTQDAQHSEIGGYWDGLIGTFISPSDTLAQWIMAFFTIAATGVLILTLRSANKTNQAAIKASSAALEANEIIRSEQRPWGTLERDLFCDFCDNGVGSRIRWNYNFANKGKSPAFDVRFELKVIRCDQFADETSMVKEFAEKCVAKPKFFKTPLIFPSEITEFRKNGSVASFRHDEAENLTAEVRPKILTCLT